MEILGFAFRLLLQMINVEEYYLNLGLRIRNNAIPQTLHINMRKEECITIYTGTWFEIYNNQVSNRIRYLIIHFFLVVFKSSGYFSYSVLGKIFRQDNRKFNRKL